MKEYNLMDYKYLQNKMQAYLSQKLGGMQIKLTGLSS